VRWAGGQAAGSVGTAAAQAALPSAFSQTSEATGHSLLDFKRAGTATESPPAQPPDTDLNPDATDPERAGAGGGGR